VYSSGAGTLHWEADQTMQKRGILNCW